MKGEDSLFQKDDFAALLAGMAVTARRRLPILKSAAPKDCQSCGACCNRYVVEVDEHDPNFQWLRDHNYTIPEAGSSGSDVMKNTDKRCIALVGTVGDSVECSIYDNRPISCRNYPAKSSACKTSILLDIINCENR